MKKQAILFGLVFAMLVSLIGANSQTVQAAGFTDVPAEAIDEVNYLSEGNIANGSSDTIFGSEKAVTRAEAAAFIGRALQLDGTKRTTAFVDVGSGNFASGYIQSAVDAGIVSGYAGGRFQPYNNVTRGEMAVIMAKVLSYSAKGTMSESATAMLSRGIAERAPDGTFGAAEALNRVDFALFLARAINPDFRLLQTNEFKETMWSNTGDLNIRSGPSVSYASKGKLAEDARVEAAHKVGDWIYIRSGGTAGFVNAFYLRSTEVKSAAGDPLLAEQTIILDPGHGGHDPGAIGYGLREKDVVLATGLKVSELFKKTPFSVKMTRSDDTFVSLDGRSAFASRNNGNVFVSIHANAATPAATGIETFYAASNSGNAADSKLLATKLQSRMLAAWNLRDRGVKQYGYQVLKYNSVPAALVELGFITNKGDNDKLKSDYWQNTMSKAIYYGILDYYKAKGHDVDSLYDLAK